MVRTVIGLLLVSFLLPTARGQASDLRIAGRRGNVRHLAQTREPASRTTLIARRRWRRARTCCVESNIAPTAVTLTIAKISERVHACGWSTHSNSPEVWASLGGQSHVVTFLVNELQHGKYPTTFLIALLICHVDSDPARTLAGLIGDKRFPDQDPILMALGLLGPEGIAAKPVLFHLLGDHDWSNRIAAVTLLGRMQSPSDDVVHALLEALKHDPDTSVRGAAAVALVNLGGPQRGVQAALVGALDDDWWSVRDDAATSLTRLKFDPRVVVPALIAAFKKHPSAEMASALGEFGPAAKDAAPALIEVLGKSNDFQMRSDIAIALGKIGYTSDETVSALCRALNDKAYSVRRDAALALGKMGESAKGAIGPLKKAFQAKALGADSDSHPALQRGAFGFALWRIDHDAKFAVEVLVEAIGHETLRGGAVDRDTYDAECLIADLGSMGSAAAGGKGLLVTLLAHPNRWIRKSAAEALGNIGGSEKVVTDALTKSLGDNDSSVRAAAALALWRTTHDASQVVPTLIEIIRTAGPTERDLPEPGMQYDFKLKAPLAALRTIGAQAKPAVPVLTECLYDRYWKVRRDAAIALAAIGSPARSAESRLIELTADRHPAVRSAARDALEAIKSP